jgi:hypothetical protein
MTCESCGFNFDHPETNCELCLTCLKTLKCLAFVKANRLCACGDDFCIHNTRERREKSAKLQRLVKYIVPV